MVKDFFKLLIVVFFFAGLGYAIFNGPVGTADWVRTIVIGVKHGFDSIITFFKML